MTLQKENIVSKYDQHLQEFRDINNIHFTTQSPPN